MVCFSDLVWLFLVCKFETLVFVFLWSALFCSSVGILWPVGRASGLARNSASLLRPIANPWSLTVCDNETPTVCGVTVGNFFDHEQSEIRIYDLQLFAALFHNLNFTWMFSRPENPSQTWFWRFGNFKFDQFVIFFLNKCMVTSNSALWRQPWLVQQRLS